MPLLLLPLLLLGFVLLWALLLPLGLWQRYRKVARTSSALVVRGMLEKHESYIREHLIDMPEVRDWTFEPGTVQGIPARQPDLKDERKGPRVGAPEGAVAGFLKATGLKSLDEAKIEKDPKKGDFYIALIEKPGRDAQRSTAGSVRVLAELERLDVVAITGFAETAAVFSFDADWGNSDRCAPVVYDFFSRNERERRPA